MWRQAGKNSPSSECTEGREPAAEASVAALGSPGSPAEWVKGRAVQEVSEARYIGLCKPGKGD